MRRPRAAMRQLVGLALMLTSLPADAILPEESGEIRETPPFSTTEPLAMELVPLDGTFAGALISTVHLRRPASGYIPPFRPLKMTLEADVEKGQVAAASAERATVLREAIIASEGAPIAQWFFTGQAPPGHTISFDAEGAVVMSNPMGEKARFRLQLEPLVKEPLSRVMASPPAPTTEEVDKYVGGIVHDLNSPLAAISGATDILMTNVERDIFTKAEVRDWLTTIQNNARRAAALVHDLLDLGKEKPLIMPQIVEPLELARASLRSHQSSAAQRNIQLEFESSPMDFPPLWADPDRIHQVLDNLIWNALKFTPRGGRIALGLALHQEDGRAFIRFTLSDNGPGVPEADRQRIFQRFAQTEAGKRHAHSAGIGLANARNLVELHGGRIWVENRSERGAVFSFILPVAPTEDQRR